MSDDTFIIGGIVCRDRNHFAERFWCKAVKSEGDGCWLWTAVRNNQKYGTFAVARCQMRLAHRVAWELENGSIPKGLNVLHRCDNSLCVRPSHLFIGTLKDNTQDMIAKKRHRHGETHPKTTLKEADVLEIRRLHAEGKLLMPQIGKLFGVGPQCVFKIVKRKRWTHI